MLKYIAKYNFMGDPVEQTAKGLFELGMLIEKLDNLDQVSSHDVHISTVDESVAPKPSKKRAERFPPFRKTSLER